MKIVATRKSEQNEAAVDPWTLVHFSAGLALGLMAVPRTAAVAGAVAYELVEQILERRDFGRELFVTAGPEAIGNAVVDVAVFTAGHRLGEAWNRR